MRADLLLSFIALSTGCRAATSQEPAGDPSRELAELCMAHPRETGVDWNVVFLLFGMMVIVGILKHTGLFEALALWAAKRSRGDPHRLLVLTVLVTAVPSPILDNVTTVLLVTPVVLQVCSRLGLDPVPYLMTVVFAANIGGMATLIGDPPNIIIASRGDLTFNDFLVHSLPITVLLGMTLLMLIVLFIMLKRRDPV